MEDMSHCCSFPHLKYECVHVWGFFLIIIIIRITGNSSFVSFSVYIIRCFVLWLFENILMWISAYLTLMEDIPVLAALRSFMFKSGISYLHHSQFGKHCSTVASPGSCFLVSKFNSSSSFILFQQQTSCEIWFVSSDITNILQILFGWGKRNRSRFCLFFCFLGGFFCHSSGTNVEWIMTTLKLNTCHVYV